MPTSSRTSIRTATSSLRVSRFPADTITWPNGAYALVHTHVHCQDPCTTSFSCRTETIQECIYAGCQLSICGGATYPRASKATWQLDLIYIRTEDMACYFNDPPWDLALFFANQIRGLVDAKDGRPGAFARDPIAQLVTAGLNNYAGPVIDRTATVYLVGEIVCDFATNCFGGAETAHTADLTIAVSPALQGAGLGCNTWVRVTNLNNGRNVVARVTDTAPSAPMPEVDATGGGIAYALGLTAACNFPARLSPP